ncbi:MAG: hypothetical protein ERJ67_08385 [Aphanocapsa feldmannii 277cV]|uniref:Uncharacterized protein n=2 Tax=Aphanocapsa feldmannii TaxID=192050 RepID=A0A524RM45_9CHRO|nr:MAG: hypothetical protein ERJ69_02785 [Aphanocapsa feldmannii 288cV]TGG91253.1 MAG: hypothetical protein ERJ67_08385 [Aphanocapsa feldmannii 277cV]TGH20618.1 MAG: hypothetical protein ERJ68_06615 [Aphanocapsa feldmannii 277cI]
MQQQQPTPPESLDWEVLKQRLDALRDKEPSKPSLTPQRAGTLLLVLLGFSTVAVLASIWSR